MAGVNPWMTIGVLQGSNGSSMTPYLQSLSATMAPLVTSDGSGGGAGGTYAQSVAGQSSSDPAASGATDQQNPLFPTKKSNTDKNYKDPRTSAPSWMGGSNLFDDDSHGANVIGQIASRPAGTSPVGGSGSPAPPPPSSGGGSSGHHGGGHDSGHHGGGGWGHGGYGGLLGGLLGRGGFGHFGRWW